VICLESNLIDSSNSSTQLLPCRACGEPLLETFVDLGMMPLSNAYIAPKYANCAEQTYPLHAYVCTRCFLVQIPAVETPQKIFSDYLYFSSYSETWLKHAARYAEDMVTRLGLSSDSLVIEVASNDGYLLQFFQRRGIPVLGIEPAANVARVAREKGIQTEIAFFGSETAERLKVAGKAADLIAANNVLAHVPDLNDFLLGFKILLKPEGVVTFEFPHLLALMRGNQFDTIYHEHFSYFSYLAAEAALARQGLKVFHVEEHPTHGGSLRIFARHAENDALVPTEAVARLRSLEEAAGLVELDTYRSFAAQAVRVKIELLDFLVGCYRANKRVVAYGAAAKGNTLLNYCGIGRELIPCCVDRSPHKQGHLLPGSHIPIRAPDAISELRPDYLFILPWNLKEEIVDQTSVIREWGGKYVVAIPQLEIF
jgi:2-polyprenyl-3-methyl-5-hydroxy-6-metoxy-1,4-benzoquinol methylase